MLCLPICASGHQDVDAQGCDLLHALWKAFAFAFFTISILHSAHCNYFWRKYNFYFFCNLIFGLVVLLLHIFYYILFVLCVLSFSRLSLCIFPKIFWFARVFLSFRLVSTSFQIACRHV